MEDNQSKEALFKLGQYYQFGRIYDKPDLIQACRLYDEAAADGHIESMNALGSLHYNEYRDYE